MRIYDSRQWIEDLDETITELPDLARLADYSVLITGCTGLIGSAVADILIRWNKTHDQKIRILAAGRDENRVADRFCLYVQEDWFTFVPYDAASETNVFDFSCDYIIHGAGNAYPARIIREPVETMKASFLGMTFLLDFAREKAAKRVLYISSSEVYGKRIRNTPCRSDEYGGIDILNPRSSYPVGKCAAETLCAAYAEEYGVEAVIVRPGHIYGPTAGTADNRVSSAWPHAVAGGGNIVMKSDGSQIRSYCYCLDCASAILTVLLKGEAGVPYNISNPDSVISIRDMAGILAETTGVELKMELPDEAEKKGFNPMSNSSLDASELMGLGWKGLFDARRGFAHTVEILKQIQLGA